MPSTGGAARGLRRPLFAVILQPPPDAARRRVAIDHSPAGDLLGMTSDIRRTPNKLAAASLAGNAVVILLVWLLFLWVSRVSSLSGLNSVQGYLVWFTALVPAVLIIAANIALARQLWRGGFHEPGE